MKNAALTHFKRIADYLEVGEGWWYQSNEDSIEFFDGEICPGSLCAGPAKTHFR